MGYFLLTGATGLLGRYLLRDLTLADLPLAVVMRPTRWESATQRIETAMACWESQLGHLLARPVVLEGDITQPDLGLGQPEVAWVTRHCQSVVHSAASLTFHADEASNEPWRSNVQGTHNVIGLCQRAGIRRYHHVSTAYVCGLRRGRILETELDVGQELGNDYERSKLTAEKEALASRSFDQVTVYRPAIIVGDAQSGFTTSYHGFYTPLRLMYSLLQSVGWEAILSRDWLGQLNLTGDERKNLVSVDWVSAAMAHLVGHRECHGKTYHLTNPKPATTESMRVAITEVLSEVAEAKQPSGPAATDDYVAAFRDQMGVYRSYWSDDPQFDSTHTQEAIPYLPCPAIDHAVMDRLVRFAIGSNFGWPREAPVVPAFRVSTHIASWMDHQHEAADAELSCAVNLCVTGPGGGQWHVRVEQGRVIEADLGLLEDDTPTCYMTSSTFALLAEGTLKSEDAMNSGRLIVIGKLPYPIGLARLFGDLALQDQAQARTRISQKVTIG